MRWPRMAECHCSHGWQEESLMKKARRAIDEHERSNDDLTEH